MTDQPPNPDAFPHPSGAQGCDGMTPEQIRALGFEPHSPGKPCPVDGDVRVEVLFADGVQEKACRADFWSRRPGINDAWEGETTIHIIGWRYANPADAQREIAAKDAVIAIDRGDHAPKGNE